jgi:N-acetyl-anhydromuramyl-L-alanine amidase AmpD
MDSVKELCAWLCQKYELAPTRKGVIVGHQDLNDDADCPGMHLYKRLPEIRQFCEDNR